MKMKMKSKAILSSLVAAALLVSGTASANHSWNGYHWSRTTSSFTVKVTNSLTSDWSGVMNNAVGKWGSSGVLQFNVVGTGTNRSRCPMSLGKVNICNYTYGNNGWLGLASINLDSSGHINQGSVKVNDSYKSSFDAAEKNHVMCQEMGHTIGLGHTSEDGSTQNTCMDYSNSSTSQWPNSHDNAELRIIYQHLDNHNSSLVAELNALTAGETFDAKACADGGKTCGADIGTHLGLLVAKTARHALYAFPEKDGSMTIHHAYLTHD